MKTGAFLIARLSSSRLAGKNVREILDKPMIQLLVERVQQSKGIDEVIIATSSLPSDDPLEEVARKLDVGCYRGSLYNVMERICKAAEAYQCDIIVELLGDNPLVHSELINDVIDLRREGVLDYAASVTKEYPVPERDTKLFTLGVRVQVYTRCAAGRYVDYPEYMEDDSRGYSAFMFEHPDLFKVGYLEAKGKWAFMNRPHLNFAVNYRKNFDFVRTVFEKQYPEDPNFSLEKVYDQLDREPHLYLQLGG